VLGRLHDQFKKQFFGAYTDVSQGFHESILFYEVVLLVADIEDRTESVEVESSHFFGVSSEEKVDLGEWEAVSEFLEMVLEVGCQKGAVLFLGEDVEEEDGIEIGAHAQIDSHLLGGPLYGQKLLNLGQEQGDVESKVALLLLFPDDQLQPVV
jgi:hypothetical protein